MASLIAPDGTVIELLGDTLIGRGQAQRGGLPVVDVSTYEGGLTVSRRHARITQSGDEWVLLVEPDARNATMVDDRVVAVGAEARLSDQAFIRLGNIVLMFRGHEEEAPSPEPKPLPLASPPQPSARGWASRLARGPATTAAIDMGELKRINPFRGLMIDESIWQDAHAYHRTRSQLDLLVAHGPGIVEGLEVVADSPGAGNLRVLPGVAVDRQGRLLTLREAVSVGVPDERDGLLYVRLRYHETFTDPQRSWSDIDEYTRVVEDCLVDVDDSAPSGDALELGRLQGGETPRDAANPLDPAPGDIDLRFREYVRLRPRPDLAVGQLIVDEDGLNDAAPRHHLGLRAFLRELTASTPYRARWLGAVLPGQPLPPVTLLYITGSSRFAAGEDTVAALRHFLDGGGTVLVDACHATAGTHFAELANDVARALERELAPVARWHPLLTVRHMFSAPPFSGSQATALAENNGFVFCGSDLGCLWSGGPEDAPADRDAIRTAGELGVNIALYARQRQFPLEAADSLV